MSSCSRSVLRLKRSLGSTAVEVLDTYEPRKTTVDAYMQDFKGGLASHDACQDCVALKDKKIGEQEMKFIHQVG